MNLMSYFGFYIEIDCYILNAETRYEVFVKNRLKWITYCKH